MVHRPDDEEKNAKARYAKIKSVPCPAFGGEAVAFNRSGIRHLIWKHGKPRLKSEQRRRFALLRYAPAVVLNSKTVVSYRVQGRASFWLFQGKHRGKTISVIVRQLRGGKKHFYSIFADHKNKKPPA